MEKQLQMEREVQNPAPVRESLPPPVGGGQGSTGGTRELGPRANVASSSNAVSWQSPHPTEQRGGININIQPAQKPVKLANLRFSNVQKFKTEFTHYHEETKGQAPLKGHIEEDAVSMLDMLIGCHPEYHHLLCHGENVDVDRLSEEVRWTYPWLNTSRASIWEGS